FAVSRRSPPSFSLRAFEAAARPGSITRAADESGRTHGAISRQIRALQDHAGSASFDKAGTGIKSNPHGEKSREVVAGALASSEQGWARVSEEAQGQSSDVACSATFAMRWSVP
ncbi:hypothetical protein OY671_010688, partial [Metschnikowia pulcherrima]